MKAVVIFNYGSSEALSYQTAVQEPAITDKQILVHIHAASVNPVDWKVRRGDYKLFTGNKFPKIPGIDFAGVVVEVGVHVDRFKPGDAVYGLLPTLKGGAYAEFAAVQEKTVSIKPKNLTYNEAATVPVSALTAYQALIHKAHLQKGQQVLINGASGGVGTFAMQIAKSAGAAVTAVCSEKSSELVKKLGAEKVIDYRKQDFTRLPDTYDVVFDTIGNKSFAACKAILKKKGTYLTTLAKPVDFIGSILTRLSGYKNSVISVAANSQDLDQLTRLIEKEAVKPVIDQVFPLKEAAAAHEYSEKGHAKGKIVLEINHA